MASDLRNKTVNGLFWDFTGKIINQLISFGISIVLARHLMPEDFGIVALCGMFLILIGIVQSGLGIALIQKKDIDDLDFSTIYFGNIAFSFACYVIVFFIAPLLSSWFDKPEFTSILRVLGLGMIIGAFTSVQGAFITRQMAFKKLFFSSLISSIISGAVGLIMTFKGFGAWALVSQNLCCTFINSFAMIVLVRWYPKLVFSFERFKGMYSFAWKQIIANFTATFSEQLRGYAIGLKYTPADLAYYNRGDGIPGIIYNNIYGSISTVLFPAMASIQDNPQAVKDALSRSMKTASYLIMPTLLGLAVISDKIIIILYSAKWAPAIPFMQLVCIIYCFSLIGGINTRALTAMGRSDVILKLEIIKRPVMLIILAFTMFISPLAIAIGQCIYAIGVCFFNAYPNKKVIGYPIREQFSDLYSNIISSTSMAVVVYFVGLLPINIYFCLTLQILTGILYYITISIFIKNDSLYYIKEILENRIKNRK